MVFLSILAVWTFVAQYLSTNSTLVLFFIAAVVFSFYSTRRPKNFPPGPRGIPILGVAPYMGSRLEISIAEWRKTYGDIIGYKVGSNLTVALNSYDTILEAFGKMSMSFSNRPDNFVAKDCFHKRGLLMCDFNATFMKERKFAATSLNKLGAGGVDFEKVIYNEARQFVDAMAVEDAEFDKEGRKYLLNSLSNIMTQFTIGRRHDCDDPEFLELLNAFDLFNKKGNLALQMTYILPWTRHFPPVSTSAKFAKEGVAMMDSMMRKKIKEHEMSLDESNPMDFIDEYLIEKKYKGDDSKDLFSLATLECMGRDMYGAGVEPGYKVVIYLVALLANRPEMQERLYEEIYSILGSDGMPKYSLREKMPFCQAVIKEVLRYRTLAPMAMPHCTSADVEFRGYHIPKGTTIMPNIYAVHNDPALWEKPEIFNPDRHVGPDGNVIHCKYLIPFCVGARACIAEKITNITLFTFLVVIFQRFRIVPTPVPGCERPHVPDDAEFTGMSTQEPEKTPVTFLQR